MGSVECIRSTVKADTGCTEISLHTLSHEMTHRIELIGSTIVKKDTGCSGFPLQKLKKKLDGFEPFDSRRFRVWNLDLGFRYLNFGCWTLDSCLWILFVESILDFGLGFSEGVSVSKVLQVSVVCHNRADRVLAVGHLH